MAYQIPVINSADSAKSVDVGDVVFGHDFNETLIHQLVVKYQACARSGTKAQKTRSDVSGGGIKPWKQKGTGRARAGTSRSPLWRTGGVTFAARPRNYDQKLNKKMFRVGMRSILSELLRQERLVVSNDIVPISHKTKDFVIKLNAINETKLLVVVEAYHENLFLAARNIVNVRVELADNLSPLSLLAAEKVIATPLAIKKIEERLQ